MRQEIRREARSAVTHLDHQDRPGPAGRQHDLSSPWREPQCVVDQVVDGLADPPRVDRDPGSGADGTGPGTIAPICRGRSAV
jgi:hypothetical protein